MARNIRRLVLVFVFLLALIVDDAETKRYHSFAVGLSHTEIRDQKLPSFLLTIYL